MPTQYQPGNAGPTFKSTETLKDSNQPGDKGKKVSDLKTICVLREQKIGTTAARVYLSFDVDAEA